MTEVTTLKSADQNSGPAGLAPVADAKKKAAPKEHAATKVSGKAGGSCAKPTASPKGTGKAAPAENKATKAKGALSTAAVEAKTPAAPKEPRQTKAATVEAMLSSKEGATLEAMCMATGWQSHTCRAFLTGLRKKGREVVRYKDELGGSIYRMTQLEVREASA